MLLIWLQFFISAGIIIIAGTKLSLYADVISERTGLSKAWIGMILLGVVTSLPEVATSVASAVKINAPDLAFGNIFGSNMINLFIIPLTDIAYRKGAILSFVSQTHILTASLGIFLTCIAIIGLTTRVKKTFFHLCWDTIVMALSYLLGTYMLFKLR